MPAEERVHFCIERRGARAFVPCILGLWSSWLQVQAPPPTHVGCAERSTLLYVCPLLFFCSSSFAFSRVQLAFIGDLRALFTVNSNRGELHHEPGPIPVCVCRAGALREWYLSDPGFDELPPSVTPFPPRHIACVLLFCRRTNVHRARLCRLDPHEMGLDSSATLL